MWESVLVQEHYRCHFDDGFTDEQIPFLADSMCYVFRQLCAKYRDENVLVFWGHVDP